MLVRVTGILESVEGARAVILLPMGPGAAVAREALIPAALGPDLLSSVGQTVTLHTLEWHESASQGASYIPRLLGFGTPRDRRFFELFTTVKGVGTKKALRAMARPVGEIARAIAERDVKALQELPEIGKRMAETIVAELHGKVDEFVDLGAIGAGPVRVVVRTGGLTEAADQALAALVRLGESRADAERMVRRAVELEPAAKSADEILTAAFASRGA
ncbi:MAG: Holliday junction DNA helicase RuvA [Phycisphaerales bacterium]|nr:Holliday junction DNA helicase RuvA [Phycisphaerales bacterium]